MTALPPPPPPADDSTSPGPARPSFTQRWRRWMWLAAGALAVVTAAVEVSGYRPDLGRLGSLGRVLSRPRGNPRARDAAADLASLARALDGFAAEHGAPPATWSELLASDHLEVLPDDPWGRPYRYAPPAGARAFLVYTLGRDDLPGGRGEDADVDHRPRGSPGASQGR